MAFGFGFNKQKVLSAAEKFVQQGKLQNAISEYEKIIKSDPKDLTVMNTVGDLYSRLGESDRAIECFKSVGDAYAQQGFTVKAIAMYKKLSKLRPTLEGALRLAELYTQQGLFNDARAQYLQVAEEFLRGGELEQAVRIFQKTLEMDPENVNMRTRLAEVYLRLGKKAEAWDIFATAAESLRARGAHTAAEEILQRMLTLDPNNSHALMLRGRMAFDGGDFATAIKNLERVADLDNHAEALNVLLQAYLQTGQLAEAGGIANKLATVHNDINGITTYADALIGDGEFEQALKLFEANSDRLLTGDSSKILETLHALIGPVRESTASLEMLLDLLQKAGEQTHLAEIYELLAHAYTQAGNFEKARDYYLKLTQLEPQNQMHADNYQQVLGMLGGKTTSQGLITAEEGAVIVDELEATAPFLEQRYPDETALAVRAAITDAELFSSYNMAEKALDPLLAALTKAPRDLRLNQRLVGLHTRAGRFAEAAVCSRNLESVYREAGYPDEASRYGELAGRYEERSGMTANAHAAVMLEPPVEAPAMEVGVEPEPQIVPEMEIAVEPPLVEVEPEPAPPVTVAAAPAKPSLVWHAPVSAPPAAPAAHAAEFAVAPVEAEAPKEIDLSNEWEVEVVDESTPAAAEAPVEVETMEVAAAPEPALEVAPVADNSQAIAETVEEIRFYLSSGLADQAEASFSKLEQLNPDAATLAELRSEIQAAAATATASAPELEVVDQFVVEEEPVVEEVAPPPPPLATPPKVAVAPPKPAPLKVAAPVVPPAPAVAPRVTAPPAPPKVAAAPPKPQPVVPPPAPPKPAVAASAAASASLLGELVSDLESSLGDDFLTDSAPEPAPKAPPKPAPPVAVPAKAAAPAAPELGELVADLETSLGDMPQATVAPAAPPAAARPAAQREISIAASAAASPTSSAPVAAHAAPPAAVAQVAAAPIDPAAVDLSGMFSELRSELEEDVAHADEDPETHYNLGVAFREMGLLDEAIGELQKVCQAVERGHAFPQLMQTYTWLAQCFLDKGVPEAAIRWYAQALKIPNLDGESSTALHYELGSAFELANDKPEALQHFLQVYGSNIDYRDVAERIKALKS
jgi:tetratricopeptide (TPR) repeat protein